MALQIFDYSKIAPREPNFGFADAFKSYAGTKKATLDNRKLGVETEYAPFKAQEELQQKKLLNALQAIENQYAPETFASKNALNRASAEHQRASAQYAGLPSGAMGNAARLHMMEQRLGEDHPLVNALRSIQELEQDNEASRLRNRDMLTETADKRYATSTGKKTHEEADVEAGFMPGTMYSDNPVMISPEKQRELLGQYAAQRRNESSDQASRQKALFAENMDLTMSQIDVDKLVKYSGLMGGLNKKLEQGKSLTGKESEDYKQYQENLARTEILADQVRSYFGTSIAPSMMTKLENLTNPSSWARSPDAAKRNYLALEKLLKAEGKTYKEAVNPQGQISNGYRNVPGTPRANKNVNIQTLAQQEAALAQSFKPASEMSTEEILEALNNGQ
jgi:hypothetical protein